MGMKIPSLDFSSAYSRNAEKSTEKFSITHVMEGFFFLDTLIHWSIALSR